MIEISFLSVPGMALI